MYLAKRGFDVYGIDISRKATETARSWLGEEGLRADLKTGDIYKRLPYESGFFDAVVSVRALHHGRIGDIRRAIENMRGVLKPNGLIFVTVRKRTGKRGRLKFKTIDSRTYVPTEGDEEGVVHYLFNKELLRKEFGGFEIHDIYVERGPKKWECYYCLLGELRPRRERELLRGRVSVTRNDRAPA